MDEMVRRSMAKWPDVPAVFGWLLLDRRGNWLLRNPARSDYERIGNARMREFIARSYAADERGRWFFQNGPQRVFVRLAYTPLVLRSEGDAFADQCGRPFDCGRAMLDEGGSLLIVGGRGVALLDDRDLPDYAEALGEAAERLPRIESSEVQSRFRFVAEPAP